MKRTMDRLPEQMLRDEAEMRAFYQSCGISESTTEAAIKVRRNGPIEQDNEPRSGINSASKLAAGGRQGRACDVASSQH